MTPRKSALSVLIVMSFLPLFSQDVLFDFETGYGSYQMKDLKEFEQYLVRNIPLEVENVNNYPPDLYYRAKAGVGWRSVKVGALWSKHSTGSVYSLVDYSGEYRYDSRVSCNSFGVFVEAIFNPMDKFRVAFEAETGRHRTELSLSEMLSVDGDEILDEITQFRSRGFFIEPGLEISYPILFFRIQASAGYCITFANDLFESILERQNFEFRYATGTVKPGWNGYRFGLGIEINFSELTGVSPQKVD